LFVVLALRLLLLCLLWSLSFAVLFGLVSPAALVFVVLGVVGGSVPLLRPKLASSALLPSGGLGCGGLLSALLPASGFGVQRS